MDCWIEEVHRSANLRNDIRREIAMMNVGNFVSQNRFLFCLFPMVEIVGKEDFWLPKPDRGCRSNQWRLKKFNLTIATDFLTKSFRHRQRCLTGDSCRTETQSPERKEAKHKSSEANNAKNKETDTKTDNSVLGQFRRRNRGEKLACHVLHGLNPSRVCQ